MAGEKKKREGGRTCPITIGISLIVGVVALMVILGWVVQSRTLVQLSPGFAPMQTTTAIGFLLFAGALFVLSTEPKWNHWHWERLLSAGLLAWGILNLLQHGMGWNLGIDTLLGEPFVTDNSPAPGRMSLLTSLCFTLGGISLILCIIPSKSPRAEVAIVSLSCFLAGLSGSSLFCYTVDIPRVIWLGARLSEMAIHTAAGFFLLSIAIIMQRFRCGRALYGEAFQWMWAPAFFGTIFAIGSIFLGFHA
ncbi:MAG: hypothetical protein ACQKBW_09680, partial [Puniceicoccales bacterium]